MSERIRYPHRNAKGVNPRGFLKPKFRHVVTVGNVGVVYDGPNRRESERAVHRWTKLSRCEGRAFGQKVTLKTTK